MINARTAFGYCCSIFVLILTLPGMVFGAEDGALSVSVSSRRVAPGTDVHVEIHSKTGRKDAIPLQALLLKPTEGSEILLLRPLSGKEGVYRATFTVKENAPQGLYVIHAWTGDKMNPANIGKASFRVGNIVADFFIANYVDQKAVPADIENYLKDFRSLGGNFLIAHNLIVPAGAFYPSKVAKTNVALGAPNDIVEQLLQKADREGFTVLLSANWDATRQSPYKDRMKEIKSIISEMYAFYRHHPSFAGFYSWQEGSGTYYAPFVREFSEHVKSLDKGLLTACAPHIDDPLLASYLSVIEELDMLIYQSAVMGSYRTDNRKKYPWRRVRDFSGLGAGAKRLQDKITLTHVELFGYLEKRRSPDHVAASYRDIFGQILSAATVTDTDGISLFTHHATIHTPLKKFGDVQESRAAVENGMKAYQLITSEVSDQRNPIALYVPYSDFVIERWNNYFLPSLDAFRSLGVPIDILPYAPRLDESVYPYYPIHHNDEVLQRLLKERTVLVLANVSGFQQTDSDLIKAFIERGGVVVAFGPQIPMGRTYERKEIFGVDETQLTVERRGVVVKDAVADRTKAGSRFPLSGPTTTSWTAVGNVRIIASFEDDSPAIAINKYGKGVAISIFLDASTAAQKLPELTRDVFAYALSHAGNSPLVDVIGANEKTDLAVARTPNGFRVAFVNHNQNETKIVFRPVGSPSSGFSQWVDLASDKKLTTTASDSSLTANIPGLGFRVLDFRRTSSVQR